MLLYSPHIMSIGCQLKKRHPAPSGRVAAKYPPNREWEDMRTRRRKYFPSGMGAIFGAMVMWGVSVVLRDLLDLGEL
jgi:hypothetical protein